MKAMSCNAVGDGHRGKGSRGYDLHPGFISATFRTI
jgi:hypothetical protein